MLAVLALVGCPDNETTNPDPVVTPLTWITVTDAWLEAPWGTVEITHVDLDRAFTLLMGGTLRADLPPSRRYTITYYATGGTIPYPRSNPITFDLAVGTHREFLLTGVPTAPELLEQQP